MINKSRYHHILYLGLSPKASKQYLHCDTRCLRYETFESLSSSRNETVSKQPSPRHPHELVRVCLRLGAGAGEVWSHELESQLCQRPLRDVLQVNSHHWWKSNQHIFVSVGFLNVISCDTWVFLNILSSLQCYLLTNSVEKHHSLCQIIFNQWHFYNWGYICSQFLDKSACERCCLSQ